MARKAKKSPAPPAIEVLAAKLSVVPSDTMASFYVNYIEVGQTSFDFTLYGARIPAKFDQERLKKIQESGTIIVDAEIEIIFPVNIVDGLISALTIQKAQKGIADQHLVEVKAKTTEEAKDDVEGQTK